MKRKREYKNLKLISGKLILLTLVVFCVGCSSCVNNSNNRGINDNRPPLINNDKFWDFIPWWHTNSIVETNNVAFN